MDPIGLALDNFDVTGQWRLREQNGPRHPRSYDGTITPQKRLPKHCSGDQCRMRNLNMMAYALARRVEYYDLPTIRSIVAKRKMRANIVCSRS